MDELVVREPLESIASRDAKALPPSLTYRPQVSFHAVHAAVAAAAAGSLLAVLAGAEEELQGVTRERLREGAHTGQGIREKPGFIGLHYSQFETPAPVFTHLPDASTARNRRFVRRIEKVGLGEVTVRQPGIDAPTEGGHDCNGKTLLQRTGKDGLKRRGEWRCS